MGRHIHNNYTSDCRIQKGKGQQIRRQPRETQRFSKLYVTMEHFKVAKYSNSSVDTADSEGNSIFLTRCSLCSNMIGWIRTKR